MIPRPARPQRADARDCGGGLCRTAHAVQAPLWRELNRIGETPPAPLAGRQVLIYGELYARVTRLALELRDARGRAVPIKAFVEDVVRRAVEREERRRQRRREASNDHRQR